MFSCFCFKVRYISICICMALLRLGLCLYCMAALRLFGLFWFALCFWFGLVLYCGIPLSVGLFGIVLRYCAFGLLCARFRIFYRKIQLEPHYAEGVIKAAVVMHNFLTKPSHARQLHQDPSGRYQFPPTVNDLYRAEGTRATNAAINVRNSMRWWCNYPGKVSWQDRMAGVENY